mmetsp:Transcript_6975/g.17277  ORF Transcript_6975/g.17277 Transcript_6975/m.17277 type:complete len:562 (-) Transcript_6975:111-1796(-)
MMAYTPSVAAKVLASPSSSALLARPPQIIRQQRVHRVGIILRRGSVSHIPHLSQRSPQRRAEVLTAASAAAAVVDPAVPPSPDPALGEGVEVELVQRAVRVMGVVRRRRAVVVVPALGEGGEGSVGGGLSLERVYVPVGTAVDLVSVVHGPSRVVRARPSRESHGLAELAQVQGAESRGMGGGEARRGREGRQRGHGPAREGVVPNALTLLLLAHLVILLPLLLLLLLVEALEEHGRQHPLIFGTSSSSSSLTSLLLIDLLVILLTSSSLLTLTLIEHLIQVGGLLLLLLLLTQLLLGLLHLLLLGQQPRLIQRAQVAHLCRHGLLLLLTHHLLRHRHLQRDGVVRRGQASAALQALLCLIPHGVVVLAHGPVEGFQIILLLLILPPDAALQPSHGALHPSHGSSHGSSRHARVAHEVHLPQQDLPILVGQGHASPHCPQRTHGRPVRTTSLESHHAPQQPFHPHARDSADRLQLRLVQLHRRAAERHGMIVPDPRRELRLPPPEVDVVIRAHERTAGDPREAPPLEPPREARELGVSVKSREDVPRELLLVGDHEPGPAG